MSQALSVHSVLVDSDAQSLNPHEHKCVIIEGGADDHGSALNREINILPLDDKL